MQILLKEGQPLGFHSIDFVKKDFGIFKIYGIILLWTPSPSIKAG
jgi:hypothetical protein